MMPPLTLTLARLARACSRPMLGAWFLAMLAVGSTLLARHAVAFPRPLSDVGLERALTALRGSEDRDRWLLVHVLYAQCKCSEQVADHLIAGRRPADVAERVLLIGSDPALEGRLVAARFRVLEVDAADVVRRYHVTAAPTLLVAAPDGSIRYSGGYTARKQGPDPRDLDILSDARAGRPSETLPVFGCAVSASLRASLNPLGLP